jgi:hypothetical protein
MIQIPASALRADLGLLVSEQALGDSRFIAPLIFPIRSVDNISDTFSRIGVKAGSQQPNIDYSGGEPNTISFSIESDNYRCQEKMIRATVRDKEVRQMDGKADLRSIASAIPAVTIMTGLEIAAEAVLNTNTNLPLSGNNGATVTAWNNASTATPITDVLTGQTAIRTKTGGMQANTLIMPWRAWVDFSQTDNVLNRIRNVDMSVTGGVIRGTTLNALLQVEQIVIPAAPKDSANQGLAASIVDIWNPDFAYLAITAPMSLDTEGNRVEAPTWGVAQVGRTMMHRHPSLGGTEIFVAEHREDKAYQSHFDAGASWDVKFFGSAFAYRLKVR